jgi:hypothetical protein
MAFILIIPLVVSSLPPCGGLVGHKKIRAHIQWFFSTIGRRFKWSTFYERRQ